MSRNTQQASSAAIVADLLVQLSCDRPERALTATEFRAQLQVGKTLFYQLLRDGVLPRPSFWLGSGSPRWTVRDVNKAIELLRAEAQ
jgi:predicted DNA-binding transcriptional regulator AlpA